LGRRRPTGKSVKEYANNARARGVYVKNYIFHDDSITEKWLVHLWNYMDTLCFRANYHWTGNKKIADGLGVPIEFVAEGIQALTVLKYLRLREYFHKGDGILAIFPYCYPERYQILKDMPYLTYIRTPEWKRLSSGMKLFVGYACEHCGASGPGVILNVHHKIGAYSRIGEEFEEDLIVLCVACHLKFHEERKVIHVDALGNVIPDETVKLQGGGIILPNSYNLPEADV